MATSSIGQVVKLNDERASRLTTILSKSYKPAKSASKEKLSLSKRKLNPRKFE